MTSKYKKKKSLAFVMLEKKLLLQSRAWKELTGSAVKVYIFLRSKTAGPLSGTKTYSPTNSDIKIPYSIIASETRIARQSVRNALIELENKGFIDLAQQGGLKSGGYTMNTYRLSIRFFLWETPEFKTGNLKKAKNVKDRGFGKWRDMQAAQKQEASTKNRLELV